MTTTGRQEVHERFFSIVRLVPRGRVATYGQVAMLAGLRGHARQVGHALSRSGLGENLPWQRVINAQGRISVRPGHEGVDGLQRRLLRREGIEFSPAGRIDLARFGWDPGPGVAFPPIAVRARRVR